MGHLQPGNSPVFRSTRLEVRLDGIALGEKKEARHAASIERARFRAQRPDRAREIYRTSLATEMSRIHIHNLTSLLPRETQISCREKVARFSPPGAEHSMLIAPSLCFYHVF